MYEASTDTSKNWVTFIEMIKDFGWSGEDVVKYLTDWHGMSLLDEDFMQNLIDCEI